MNESEDAINKAESFFRDQKDTTPFPVRLSVENIKEIRGRLGATLAMDEAFGKVFDMHGGLKQGRQPESTAGDGLPMNNQESLLADLFTKFDNITKHDSAAQVSIPLNGIEVDFINKFLKPKIRPSAEDEEKWEQEWKKKTASISPEQEFTMIPAFRALYSDENVEKWFVDISFEHNKRGMAYLIELNLAFIKAGGKAREDFLKFYDGNLPNPDSSL